MRAALEQVIVRRKWDPRRLGPALALWIDPSENATMLASSAGGAMSTDGGVCGFAADKSGNSFHLTSAADDTTRPTWNNNAGLPYLNFDGVNDVLLRAATLGLYAASGLSIFVAARGNPAASASLIAEGSSAGSNPVYAVRSGATSTSGAEFIRNDANTQETADAILQALAWNNTDKVIGWTDSTSAIQWYANGAAGTSGSYTRSGAHTVDRFSLGALVRNTTASWFATRIYGLVIVKRVLTAGEIANTTTYLGAKMGLVL